MVELEDIKNAVSRRPVFEPIAAEPLPDEIADLEKMIESTSRATPIFIKMDKYKEILERIHGLRLSIEKIDGIIKVRKNMHEINIRSEEALEKSFKEFSDATNSFRREFVVSRGMPFQTEENQDRKADEHVSKLSDEILKLKEELDSLQL